MRLKLTFLKKFDLIQQHLFHKWPLKNHNVECQSSTLLTLVNTGKLKGHLFLAHSATVNLIPNICNSKQFLSIIKYNKSKGHTDLPSNDGRCLQKTSNKYAQCPVSNPLLQSLNLLQSCCYVVNGANGIRESTYCATIAWGSQ